MALGILVGRFGNFVREKHEPPVQAPPEPPQAPTPDVTQRVREACAHHIIPLALLARADGNSAPAEQKAIVTHCLSVLKRAGATVGAAEQAALASCVAEFRPTLMQLDPSLMRIEQEGIDSVHRLIAAAILVIEADGKRDPAELHFLDLLSEDLAKLHGL